MLRVKRVPTGDRTKNVSVSDGNQLHWISEPLTSRRSLIRCLSGWCLFWACWLSAFILTPHAATAAEPASAVHCVPGTGAWAKDGDVLELRAALCDTDPKMTCPDFATLRFEGGGEPAVTKLAATPEALQRCRLTWQGALGATALYSDGETLLSVDVNTLQVVSRKKSKAVYEVEQRGKHLLWREKGGLKLLGVDAQGAIKTLFEVKYKDALLLEWSDDALFLIEPRLIRRWSLDADGVPTKLVVERKLPVSLIKDRYALSPDGVLTFNPRSKGTAIWYSFDGAEESRTARGNDQMYGVGGGSRAGAVVSEGDLYLKFFVPRRRGDGWTLAYHYVKRRSASLRHRLILAAERSAPSTRPGPMVLSQGDYFVVDGRYSTIGGKKHRPPARGGFAVINVEADDQSNLQIVGSVDFKHPGLISALDADHVYVFHTTGPDAITMWKLGSQLGGPTDKAGAALPLKTITRADYDALGLTGFPEFKALGAGRFLLSDKKDRLAVLDVESATVSVRSTEKLAGGEKEGLRRVVGDQYFYDIVTGSPPRVSRWVQIAFSSGKTGVLTTPSKTVDAFDVGIRWFGYCVKGEPCALEFKAIERAPGDNEHLRGGDFPLAPEPNRPLLLPLILIAVTLLLLIIIVAWRLGWRRKMEQRVMSEGALVGQIVPLDVVIEDEFYRSEIGKPRHPYSLSPHRGILRIKGDLMSLEIPNSPVITLPIEQHLLAEITRLVDFAQVSAAGLLGIKIEPGSLGVGKAVQFNVEIPGDVRVFERVLYRNDKLALRVSWEAFLPLVEVLRERRDLRETFYRKLVRSAHDGEMPIDEPSGIVSAMMLDELGRRYITRQDRDVFIRRFRWTRWPFRLVYTLLVASGVALTIGYTYLKTEPLMIKGVLTLSLVLPVAALSWVFFSWGTWNRLRLLRFGNAVQGVWRDNNTLLYTLLDGRTYRLRRKPWNQVDLMPLVLCDPRRPSLAVQFTGHRNLGDVPVSSPGPKDRPARSFDLLRLLVVIALFAGLQVGAVFLFEKLFPEPLPAETLDRLESDADGGAMLSPCLNLCATVRDKEACRVQCQRRQLKLALERGGITLERDPDMTPGLLRAQQADRIDALFQSLRDAPAGGSCDVLAEKIKETPRWDDKLQDIFNTAYGDRELMKADPAFIKADQRLDALQSELFAPLCSPSKACLEDPAKGCPAPPACEGDPEGFKQALCGLAPAVRPIFQ